MIRTAQRMEQGRQEAPKSDVQVILCTTHSPPYLSIVECKRPKESTQSTYKESTAKQGFGSFVCSQPLEF